MLAERFRARFGAEPEVVASAPGRVNLIGEHTDYNDGFVLPMAIDRRVSIAARRRADDAVEVEAHHDGARYVRAVVEMLRSTQPIPGIDVLVEGDVPAGAGLSSSAALELATARAVAELAGIAWDGRAMARLAQRAENEIIGVRCGIMDQLASAEARRGCAMLIDCRTLEIEHVVLHEEVAIVVMDTGSRRRLSATEYNIRRASCERAARELGVPALRDVTLDMLRSVEGRLGPKGSARARHVVEENARPAPTAEALRVGNLARAGRLMLASHASLRDLFEVSSQPLDQIVQLAERSPACYGARLTGAGFGGCAIALVRAPGVDEFFERVPAQYEAMSGLKSRFFVARADDGARLEL